jgi:ATP-binding cassette, subfamily C, bacterial
MKYQWVRQQSGEDCAAASLAIVIKHYGRNFKINRIREVIGTGKDGTTLLGVKRGAESLGFTTKALKVKPDFLDRLENVTLPAIIYWKGYHFAVLYGEKGDKYVISDPGMGIRYLEKEELLKDWQGGIILLLQPNPLLFFLQPDDKDNIFDSLLQRLYPHRGVISALIPCNLALGVLSLATPLFLEYTVDKALLTNKEEYIINAIIAFLVIQIVNNLIYWLQVQLSENFIQRLQIGLKTDSNQQILHLPISYHESRYNSAVGRRLGDIQQIISLIYQIVIDLPVQIFTALAAILILGYFNWKLTLITASIGTVISAITIALQPLIKQATQKVFSTSGHNLFILSQVFSAALMVKTTGAAQQLEAEVQENLAKEIESNKQHNQIIVAVKTVKKLLLGLGNVAIICFAANFFFHQELTIGQLVALTGIANIFLASIDKLTQFLTNFTQVKATTQLLAEIFDCTPENQGDDEKPVVALSSTSDITCNRINFHYPGRVKLLDDFSVTIPGGKVTAIIGQSGCGKSSLAKLLIRLYSMQSGNICIGEHDIQNLPLDCLRQQATLVPQEATFLTRSIIDNLHLGKADATLDEIINALKIADAYNFIDTFPEKYNTIIGAFSANLSGGQKQRIAIARAVLQNPPILILDESTANLDPPTETIVLDNILAHRQEKTTILISHRPRVINRANWIIFMEQGQLKFQGSIEDFRENMTEHLNFINP